MANTIELRTASYAIMGAVRAEPDPMVRRILAAHAFALAQQAQLQGWAERDADPKKSKKRTSTSPQI